MNQELLVKLMVDAKLKLRIHTDAFNEEISDLISAAAADLVRHNACQETHLNGMTVDPLVKRAILTFVRAYFGQPDDQERLQKDYENQKAMLMTTSGYTDWGNINGQI